MEPADARLGHTPLAEHQAASAAGGQRAPRPHPPEPAKPKPVPATGESARQSTCRPALGARRAPGARRCIGGARGCVCRGRPPEQKASLRTWVGHRGPASLATCWRAFAVGKRCPLGLVVVGVIILVGFYLLSLAKGRIILSQIPVCPNLLIPLFL